MEK
ncbi:Protein of unknown function [Bacillus mycoides]|jgi:alpha-amylase|eukprot:symbB.v1.2.043545.t1/scaffold15732.1/size760/1